MSCRDGTLSGSELVTQKPPERFAPGSVPDAAAGRAPLLEREAELATLQARVLATSDGAGQLVVIEARAGMGKTRLLAEARAAASAAGLEVIAARGGELEQEFAYGIVRQLFEPALEACTPDVRAELLSGAAGTAAPLFAAVDSAALEEAGDISFAIQHGLYWLTANIASQRPTLIAIDDLQWADGPSLRWLVYLAHRLEGLPLLLVLALRPSERTEQTVFVSELLADPEALHLRPHPLGARSVTALTRAAFGVEPDPSFTAACQQASGGNPLFLRALLHTLADLGVAATAEGATRVAEVGPRPVALYVTRVLSRLPADTAAFARAAAILGDGSELRHAAALAEVEPATAGSILTALSSADILRPADRIEFVHPVVRTSVYETIDVGERQRGHRAAAGLLLEAGAEPEHVAAHLARVPPVADPSVPPVLRDAARRALARGAAETAVSHLRRALDEPPAESDRVAVLTELGTAELLVSGPAALDHLRLARELTDDPIAGAQLGGALAYALFFTQRVPESVETYQRELAALGDGQPELRRTLEAGLANIAMYEPNLQDVAREIFDRARAQPLESDASAKRLLGLLVFHDTLSGQATASVAVDRAREALADGVLIEHDNGGASLVLPCRVLAAAGHVDEVLAIFDVSLAAAHRDGSALAYAAAHVFRAEAFLFSGDLAAAEAEAREAIEAATAWGVELGRSYPTAFLASALIERGDRGGAAEALEYSGFGDEIPLNGHAIYVFFARSRLRALSGEPEQALEDLLETGRRYQSVGGQTPALLSWRSEAALIALQLGRVAEAQELAEEELELAHRYGAPRPLGRALRTFGLALGGNEGEQRLHEAVELLAPSTAQLEHAKALVDLGAALRRRNERSHARKLLREGIEIGLRCGAIPLVERANDELAATGAHRRTIQLSGVDALTASERRVAQLAADGSSNKEIAQILFVTVKTVEMHLSRVYRKLELTSRGQLADVFSRHANEAPAPA
jgi:DNA-binding CsgD family transcriptional regulator